MAELHTIKAQLYDNVLAGVCVGRVLAYAGNAYGRVRVWHERLNQDYQDLRIYRIMNINMEKPL